MVATLMWHSSHLLWLVAIGGGITERQTGAVDVLYVDEAYPYQGIGRLLLGALTQQQVESGAVEQWVSMQEGNYRGIPFYEARGFTFWETKTTRVSETGETLVSLRYWRRLASNTEVNHHDQHGTTSPQR